jgi:hypothetical protein
MSHEVGHNMGLGHDGHNLADGTSEGYYTVSQQALLLLLLQQPNTCPS